MLPYQEESKAGDQPSFNDQLEQSPTSDEDSQLVKS